MQVTSLNTDRLAPFDQALGDHHRVLAALEGLMPVADHRLAAGLGVGGDRHPLGGAVEAQRLCAM